MCLCTCTHTYMQTSARTQKGQRHRGACQHPLVCMLPLSLPRFLKAQSAAGVQNVSKTMRKGERSSAYVGHLCQNTACLRTCSCILYCPALSVPGEHHGSDERPAIAFFDFSYLLGLGCRKFQSLTLDSYKCQ